MMTFRIPMYSKLKEWPSIWLVSVRVGCWHHQMTMPLSREGMTYRICRQCGLYRLFDPQRWKSYGTYYYNLPVDTGGATSRVIAHPFFREKDVGSHQIIKKAA